MELACFKTVMLVTVVDNKVSEMPQWPQRLWSFLLYRKQTEVACSSGVAFCPLSVLYSRKTCLEEVLFVFWGMCRSDSRMNCVQCCAVVCHQRPYWKLPLQSVTITLTVFHTCWSRAERLAIIETSQSGNKLKRLTSQDTKTLVVFEFWNLWFIKRSRCCVSPWGLGAHFFWFGGLSDNVVAGIQLAETLTFAVGRRHI